MSCQEPLQEEEVEQEDQLCEEVLMDPDHDELELEEEDPDSWRRVTRTGPSEVHPSLFYEQSRSQKLCSKIQFHQNNIFYKKSFYLESYQELSQVIIKFGSFLKISFQFHKSIVSLNL